MDKEFKGYAANVPHAAVITPDGKIDPKYLRFSATKLAGADREDCPHCGAMMERGDGVKCNRCGKDWPEKTSAEHPALQRLLEAKRYSDHRDYPNKHRILRELLAESPHDFYTDSEQSATFGLTHRPTGFRIHAPRQLVPASLLYKLPAAGDREANRYSDRVKRVKGNYQVKQANRSADVSILIRKMAAKEGSQYLRRMSKEAGIFGNALSGARKFINNRMFGQQYFRDLADNAFTARAPHALDHTMSNIDVVPAGMARSAARKTMATGAGLGLTAGIGAANAGNLRDGAADLGRGAVELGGRAIDYLTGQTPEAPDALSEFHAEQTRKLVEYRKAKALVERLKQELDLPTV